MVPFFQHNPYPNCLLHPDRMKGNEQQFLGTNFRKHKPRKSILTRYKFVNRVNRVTIKLKAKTKLAGEKEKNQS